VKIELKAHSYEQRCNWISDMKDKGNLLYKEASYDEAIDTYMKALCGFEFKKSTLKKSELTYIDSKLKLPILNNMSLSLMQLGKTSKQCMMQAKNTIDQVLKIDPKNEKAIMRKC